jgi:hypothetical protein
MRIGNPAFFIVHDRLDANFLATGIFQWIQSASILRCKNTIGSFRELLSQRVENGKKPLIINCVKKSIVKFRSGCFISLKKVNIILKKLLFPVHKKSVSARVSPDGLA